jgi:hypothetical protein
VAQRLEQAADAIAMLGRAEQNRRDQPRPVRVVREYPVARRLHVGEQLLHQRVVVVGKLLQHGEALALLQFGEIGRHVDDLAFGVFAVDEGALQGEIDEAGDDAVLEDRQLPENERLGTGRLQPGQHVARAG